MAIDISDLLIFGLTVRARIDVNQNTKEEQAANIAMRTRKWVSLGT